MIEVKSEIFEEVAFVRVVAVAQHNLIVEMLPIMLQLHLYVRHLSVELILLCRLGCIKVFVCHKKNDSRLALNYQSRRDTIKARCTLLRSALR